ncbi:proliferating cell nuclear antigen (pcna) [Candidatus Woesearchaeota archaeon]|nr:proliferating cell nuclear antigen (pcna) [Candidatus Woesearchaeota archaeon]
MKLTLAEPKYLKDSISIISDLVNEARFKITPQAIELVAMDPANVAMVIFKLFSSTFTEYAVSGDVELGINLSNLKSILKRCGPSDMLSLEMEDNNKLKIILKGKATRTFSIPIIELDEREQKVPDLKFPISIMTSSDNLNAAIEDVDVVAESVQFICEPGKFVVSAEGDLSKAKIEIPPDDDTKILNETGSTLKAKYSIEYLKKMMAGSKLADKVKVQFNSDYPLRIEYSAIDRVHLAFILAPRVEND